MTRYPKPTEEDLSHINAIIARVTIGAKGVPHFAHGDFTTGGHLSKRFTGYRPDSPCTGCRRKLFDKLRTLAGMTFARHPLTPERIAVRLATCHECPAYHPTTDSCGRLILDAISPKPVMIEGVEVLPCGCICTLKAMFRSEQCPSGKWPA